MLGEKKILGLSYIRIIATMLVLIGHCTTLSYGTSTHLVDTFSGAFPISQGIFRLIFSYIYSFHIPLFVTLSGALFDRESNDGHFMNFVKKKVRRLLVPYFLTATILYIPTRYFIGYYAKGELTKAFVSDLILGQDINYLWYLIMLMEVNIVFYFIRKYAKQFYENRNLCMIIGLAVLNIAGLHLDGLPFQIHRTLECMLWFYFGTILRKEVSRFKTIATHKIYMMLVLQLFVFFIYSYLSHYALHVGYGVAFFSVKLLLELIRLLLAFFGVLFFWMFCLKIDRELTSVEKEIEAHSFKIYLLHVPIITMYSWAVQTQLQSYIINDIQYVFFVLLKLVTGLLGSELVIRILTVLIGKCGRTWKKQ